MKKQINLKNWATILLVFIFLAIYSQGYAQTCINENQTQRPWTNIPYFTGDNSYVEIREGSNESETKNPTVWLENKEFDIDTWVKCTWEPSEASQFYVIFSAYTNTSQSGHSLYVYFEKYSQTDWRIQINDGYNQLKTYMINYDADFKNKWKHIAITYDKTTMRLYIDGAKVSEGAFSLGDIPWYHVTVGDHTNRANDFKGYISGYRIWSGKKFTDAEIAYIWNKTFDGANTYKPGSAYLNDYLKINMFTGATDIYSTTADKSMVESGITRSTTEYHPAQPVRSYGLRATQQYSQIRLDWTRGTTYSTNWIYRRKESETGWGILLCRTNDSYYVDADPNLVPGVNYVYYMRTVWYNSTNPRGYDNGYYEADTYENLTDAHVTTSILKPPLVKNFRVMEDASTGNCTGVVKFQWDANSPTPEGYWIDAKIGTGSWERITTRAITGTTFTHSVLRSDSLGQTIMYDITAINQGNFNYSASINGTPNKPCTTAPTAVTSSVSSGNMVVSWSFTQSGAPATAFRIYRSVNGGNYDLLKSDIAVSVRSYTDLQANMCVNYQYKIEAYNSCGATPSGASTTAKVPIKYNNVFTYNSTPHFEGSKGYFNKKVDLDWTVNPDKKANIENFEIYRRKPGQTFTLLTTISNSNSTSYPDLNTDANQLYEYLIRATGHCSADPVISDTLKTIGFRTSTGIVSGKISFTGGNAVEGAEVVVDTDNPVPTSSMYFNGQSKLMLTDPANAMTTDSLVYNSISFETWIKPELSNSGFRKVIFAEDNLKLYLALVNMRPVVTLNNQAADLGAQTPLATASADKILLEKTWYHLAFTLDITKGRLALFLDGELIGTATFSPSKPWARTDATKQKIQIGGSSWLTQDLSFYGNIDETRLWKRAKTDEEIKQDYKRILTGSEQGLIAYWRFDENYGNYTYDVSKSGTEFNKVNLNAQSTNLPEWSSQTPSFSQLHPSGISDKNGNYIIKGIRYSGDGEIFSISPVLGVHEFDPTNLNLFISDNTPIHNNVDFTDISAFRITGLVYYEKTNMPVKDAFVKIDGNFIQSADNSTVMTDANGGFDIQVPIGNHYITVEKSGHTFVSAYYPLQSSGTAKTKFYFNEPIYGLKFWDNTLVKLAGRVVGGAVEQAKPIGSKVDTTKNNIGVCQIIFTTEKGYSLRNEKTDTTIYTNPRTGLYQIELNPETYKITTVKVNNTYNFLNNEAEIISLTDCFDKQYTIDTIKSKDGSKYIDTAFVYNKQKDWIWRSTPQIIVNSSDGSPILGDSLYILNVGVADTIRIATVTNKKAVYAFGKPVFSQERAYQFEISAFEQYTNSDNPIKQVIDTVPVTDGNVVIINECSNDASQYLYRLNADGKVQYDFFGGLPNLANPFTKKMEIKLKIGENYYAWSQSPQQAYVSGNVPTGNNFVTKGPDKIDYVLRDPPGSLSFAMLEKGYSKTSTVTTTSKKGWSGSEKATFHLGNKITTTAGTPFFSVGLELDLTRDIAIGFDHSQAWGNESEKTETFSTNQSFQTSSDPTYVGVLGDVFIGHGNNILYGASRFIEIVRVSDVPTDAETLQNVTIDGKDYTICKKKGLYMGNEFGTTFVYSQDHIENYLIPDLAMMRNNVYDKNKQYYTLRITDSSDDKFLSNNDDKTVWGNSASDKYNGPSYMFDNPANNNVVDSVRYYNNQIIAWKKVLDRNEYCKVMSVPSEKFPKNVSFDAGAVYSSSLQSEITENFTETYECTLSPYLAGEFGFTANNAGFSFEFEQRYTYDKSVNQAKGNSATSNVGFTLQESSMGDYLSVDIKEDAKDNFGPVFSTRGGQTSCPYEGATYTKYYNPGTIISQATMQIEVPKISVANNIMAGVPETDPAVFQVGLANNSEVNADIWYTLLVDPASNPGGAIVAMDGVPMSGAGKSILIPAGKTVNKTLTVLKGKQDVNNYDSIRVILHSQCQFDPTDAIDDIADTVLISAHFSPTCTNVKFGKIYDKWTANVSNNDTLSFQITGYNLNSTKFKSISFQYAVPGSPRTTEMVFYKNQADFNSASEPKAWINGKTTIDYNFAMGKLNDGTYQLFLKSTCNDGSEYITSPLTGIIDRVNPRPFGSPQPADGVLSAGDEIGIVFNEAINSGDLYSHSDYIEVRGVTNGTDLVASPSLLHDASLHFDGVAQNMLVRNGINLNYTSFTIEFWGKRDRIGKECLVSLGNTNDGLWIGFNESNNFVFRLGKDVLTSTNTYASLNEWNHYACVYDKGDDQYKPAIRIVVSSGSTTEEKLLETNSYSALEAILYAGYCPFDATAFNGNMHELRIWNTALSKLDISSNKSKILNGYEQGLYGLWQMNDAIGKTAQDKAFGRNGEVNATWQVSRNGKALTFNGTGYGTVPTENMIFNKTTDFTIEFWFKAAAKTTDMCLLSNGKSDGTGNENAWNITIKANKFIEIQNNGTSVAFDATNYLDNNWQHIAMSLNRRGYLSVYINGSLVKTSAVSQFKGFGASKLIVGARWYYSQQTDHYDAYFTGVIDELRFWNSARTVSQIERLKNHALNCNEFGLKAYFPFEDVTIADPSITNQTLNNLTKDDNAIAGNMTLNTVAFSSESPKIKLHRPEVSIPFDYVVNDDNIIITPSVDAAEIENVILDISVKKVKDLNNNVMNSTATWTAFVDKNQVVWDVADLNILKHISEEKKVTVNIMNKSGINENFEIQNIPDWLDVSPQFGDLLPQQTTQVTITAKSFVNIGKYSRDLQLVSSVGYKERLNVSLKVTGTEPTWTVTAGNYEFTSNLIGQLKIGGVFSTDPDDKVAAFINGECRGVANVQYMPGSNNYLVFMSIYDNVESGNEITFKVYDASTGEIYPDVTPKLTFQSNAINGSIGNPKILEAVTNIEQVVNLNKNWTWVSFYVYNNNFSNLKEALKTMSPVSGDMLKSASSFAQYSSDFGWSGTLKALNYKEMFKLNSASEKSFSISGVKLISDTISINIVSGWNWLGFPSQKQVGVKEALSSLTLSTNDIIKSQQKFAVYDNVIGWMGSLDYLEPGKGYMINVSKAGKLTISGSSTKSALIMDDGLPKYPTTANNMTMIAELDVPNSESYNLYAYHTDTLCGAAVPIRVLERSLYFISINSDPGSKIMFKIDDKYNELTINEQFTFKDNEHYGTISDPVKLSVLTSKVVNSNENVGCNVYPNPFRNILNVNLNIKNSEEVNIILYDISGHAIFETGKLTYPAGQHTIYMDKSIVGLPTGVYIIKVMSQTNAESFKIIKH